MSSPAQNLTKIQGYMSKIRIEKSSFLLWQLYQFNHYGWLILLKVYWFLNSKSQNYFGTFSYKAHFRPQISSNKFVIKENYFFCSYFRHISLCFYSKFNQESMLDVEFDSTSNLYPHCILLVNPATPKTRNT